MFAGEWYDYAAKYTPGGMELTSRRGSPPRAPSACGSSPSRAFAQAGCDGLARVDFFVDGEQVL